MYLTDQPTRRLFLNQALPAAIVTYDGAPFGFVIALGSDGRGGGEATLGRENPDPALLTWQMRLAQR
jgi:hypothetical protein